MNSLGFEATAPSNIALLKYWGKAAAADQWPANDSLSMTLQTSRTVTWAQMQNDTREDVLYWERTRLPSDDPRAKKIQRHLQWLRQNTGFAKPLRIHTYNTFPTGCGIASSASGMAALTVAALAAWTQSDQWDRLKTHGFDRSTLAQFARMGSGSAGRSLFGGYVAWNKNTSPTNQSIAPLPVGQDWSLVDLIVVISHEAKAISSSAGHELAATSPLFAPRVAGIAERRQQMEGAIRERDFAALGLLMEIDALEMHSVMMTMTPPANYLLPATVEFISWLREKRHQQGLRAYFTIDAGPNVHVLCEPSQAALVRYAIQQQFPQFSLIDDAMGHGPTLTAKNLQESHFA